MAFGLAHVYDLRRGQPGWGPRVRWGVAGYTPSLSSYDADLGVQVDANMERQVRNGVLSLRGLLNPSAPTMTRRARISAQLDSLPAARFFQSYTGSGTGHNWSGGTAIHSSQVLSKNFNPNMQGAAELHPAMTYDPFPSPSSLYPKVV